MVQKISILGATGSIGDSTLQVIAANPDDFCVAAVTAGSNVKRLAEICHQFKPQFAAIADEALYNDFKAAIAGLDIETACGEAGVSAAAAYPTDRVMAAITGFSGLKPTLNAVQNCSIVMLANKECLVAAGYLFMDIAAQNNTTILPVDSEHNALHQLLVSKSVEDVKHLTLTASGGPFVSLPIDQLAKVTPEMAVKHPVWSMGEKISIDSATMLNKGLELIEAQHLFSVPANKLNVLIHPQSIIHGLITMYDGSVMAHMGTPDMQIPIAYCLGWPERLKANIASLDLAAEGELSFLAPDFKRYPCLELAYEALNAGQGTQTVMNAANEIAVEAFRNGEISFTYIASLIHDTMDQMTDADISSLSDVYAVDEAARRKALDIISLKK